MSDVATAGPLAAWTPRVFLSGLLALALGTICVVLGVLVAGTLIPGIVILDLALVLLAASGVLAVIGPDA